MKEKNYLFRDENTTIQIEITVTDTFASETLFSLALWLEKKGLKPVQSDTHKLHVHVPYGISEEIVRSLHTYAWLWNVSDIKIIYS